MIIAVYTTIVALTRFRGGLHVILVSFLSDHRAGRRSAGFFKHRGRSRWYRKDPARGIPGLIPRFALFRKTSSLRPVNVRVAPVLT